MKRLASFVSQNTRSKKPRLESPLLFKRKKHIIVSASHLYNYMNKDPLVDWLKLSSRRGTRRSPAYTSNSGSFTDFIMNRGVQFESELIKYINANKLPVVSVSEYINDDTCEQTIKLMRQGVPVIHSAPVKNNHNGTQGVIDLLVRSDKISELVEETPCIDNFKAPKLSGDYHYVVIDVKFSTLPLRSDGKLLLNSGSYPAYKAQVCVYNQAIGQIQGYEPRYAYIMGRRWKYTKQDEVFSNYTCLNKLGTIDFKGVDSDYKILTKNAIQWVRDVTLEGHKWSIDPPSRVELYPNMCVDSGIWNEEKEKIADKIGEITSIWNCGIKHRNNALNNDIKSWKDSKCTTEIMGIKGVRAPIIDKIIQINRQIKDNIWPKQITSNVYDWKTKGNEVFVDFETMSDIFADFNKLPYQEKTEMIFMIGVGYEENGKWVYKNFTCKNATYDEEYRIMNEFNTFLSERNYPKMYHWCADANFWKTAEERQFCKGDKHVQKNISKKWTLSDWADLCKLFQSEPIVIKDCFKFGLKNIAKAMEKHKMISTSIESDCNSGMSAQINAWKCYKNNSDPINSSTMKDITKYNEFDCKVLWDILTYLRKNHL